LSHSEKFVEKRIREALKDVIGITDIDSDANLLDTEQNINPVDFIYIFDMLEKNLNLPVHDIFSSRTFDVMTVENLTNAFLKLDSFDR